MDSAYVTESFMVSYLQLPWTSLDSTICTSLIYLLFSELSMIYNGLQWSPMIWQKHQRILHLQLHWTPMDYVIRLNIILIYLETSITKLLLKWTPKDSNNLYGKHVHSKSPSPLDSDGLYHMSNCYFDLSRDFYYKTPINMGSKGL